MSLLFSVLFLSLGWFTAAHFPPWVSWHGEIWAFAAVMWAVACLLFLKNSRSRHVIFPNFAWPILLLAVVVIVQMMAGSIEFVGHAWVLLFYLALCLGAMGVGYNIGGSHTPSVEQAATTQTSISFFAKLVLLGGLFSVAVAFVQAIGEAQAPSLSTK